MIMLMKNDANISEYSNSLMKNQNAFILAI